jgi:hypothetical protein
MRAQHAPGTARPGTLYIQFHRGVYRSDDAGELNDVGTDKGLPSDFGFPW